MRTAIVGLWLAALALICAGLLQRRAHDPERVYEARSMLSPPMTMVLQGIGDWVLGVDDAAHGKPLKSLADAGTAADDATDADRLRAFFASPAIDSTLKNKVDQACGALREKAPAECVRAAQVVLADLEREEWNAQGRADDLIRLSLAPAVVGLSLLLARAFLGRRARSSLA